jgi:predicted secreted Zn-dependent protease
VQAGDSLFSVAETLGLSPNELVYWNRELYPTLQTTPALKAGWVLVTDGPPLPTPTPRPTPTPPTQLAGPPNPGLEAFPAGASVTVSYYAISGSTRGELFAAMDANGPYSEWLGSRADAATHTRASFNFRFRTDAAGCSVVLIGAVPVTATYEVTLPSWTAPAGVPDTLVDWWAVTLDEILTHEAHHVELYETYFAEMNAAVQSGTCDTIEAELGRLSDEANLANCEFDLEEYGYAVGLTLDSCVTTGS